MTKIAYNYDAESGEFLGAEPVDESPVRPGRYFLPANSTEIAPPVTGPKAAAVFSKDSHSWRIVPDWRGVALFSKVDGGPLDARLGQTPEELGSTDMVPPDLSVVWDGSAWVRSAERWQALFERDKNDALTEVDHSLATMMQGLANSSSSLHRDTLVIGQAVADAILAEQPVDAAGQAFLLAAGIAPEGDRKVWALTWRDRVVSYAKAAGLAERLRHDAIRGIDAAVDEDALGEVLRAHRGAVQAVSEQLLV